MSGPAPSRVDGAVALFGVVVVVALVVAASTSSVAFSPYNGNWEGGSRLQAAAGDAGADTDVIVDTDEYRTLSPAGTLSVVLSPQRPYTRAETGAVEQFVRDGGTLLVAEDFGRHTNPLLAGIGARSRIDGRLLVDEKSYYNSPTLPVTRPDTSVALLDGVDSFTMNHGTVIVPNGAQPLIESSELATLRSDGGAVVSDTIGPYPLVTVEPLGRGTVIVVSDSSALINVMLDRPGNAAFVDNLFSRHAVVVLDYSHSGNVPPLSQAREVLESTPLLRAVVVVVGILAVGLVTAWLSRRDRAPSPGPSPRRVHVTGTRKTGANPTPSSTRLDENALVAHLRSRHPEWSHSRTRHVARAIETLAHESSTEPRE